MRLPRRRPRVRLRARAAGDDRRRLVQPRARRRGAGAAGGLVRPAHRRGEGRPRRSTARWARSLRRRRAPSSAAPSSARKRCCCWGSAATSCRSGRRCGASACSSGRSKRAGKDRRERTMRACEPSSDGYVERDGVKVFYEVFGEGEPTVLLLPTWSIIHSRQWKFQVPDLARRGRVVTFDGRGNGRSDRPADSTAYRPSEFAADALAVLDATGTESAVLVGVLVRRPVGARAGRDPPGAGARHRLRRPEPSDRPTARAARGVLLHRAARHHRGLGEVQPALLAGALPGLPGVLLRAAVQRTPLHQADRGLCRLGSRNRPGDAHRHRLGCHASRCRGR